MSTRIEGLDGVLSSIDNVADSEKIREAMGRACALVERSAKQKAPKDTGALRRSIESKVEEESGNVIGIVYTPLEYAPYVEFGTGLFAENGGRTDVPWHYQDDKGNWHSTSGQHPQPYMRPALQENRTKILRIIREALTND
jgi:HK97 gp10 family phage protein